MKFGAVTDVGLARSVNQDSFYINETTKYIIAIVADGMGGHAGGEVASAVAVEEISGYVMSNVKGNMEHEDIRGILATAFDKANGKIKAIASDNTEYTGMGTTATACILYNGCSFIAHVGDSRAYAMKDEIVQITKDHSLVQELIESGSITEDEAENHPKRNVITRALGTESELKVDIYINKYDGEVILLCSDGLVIHVKDDEILKEIKACANLQRAVDNLCDMAKKEGGIDNITVVAFSKQIKK